MDHLLVMAQLAITSAGQYLESQSTSRSFCTTATLHTIG